MAAFGLAACTTTEDDDVADDDNDTGDDDTGDDDTGDDDSGDDDSGDDDGGDDDTSSGDCLAGVVLQMTPWQTDINAWICNIDPKWNEKTEPACPDTYGDSADCGPWGGGFGFWLRADGTYDLATDDLLIEYTHGKEYSFGTSLTGLPENTDIEVVQASYRTLRFRFEGETAVIHGLTWEPQ